MMPKNAKKKDSTLAPRPSEHAPRTRINSSFHEKRKTANTLIEKIQYRYENYCSTA